MMAESKNPPNFSEEAKRALLLQLLKQKQQAAAQEEFPPSFAQQRLWFMDQWHPGSPMYNIPVVLRLQGPLNQEALLAALNNLVQRHEVLRTTFVVKQDRPVQVIAPALELDVQLEDMSSRDESAAWQLMEDVVKEPFDLTQLPLLRVMLIRLASEEHFLFINVHHIIFDGWSTGVLLNELRQDYDAFKVGLDSPLPELDIQYADFAVWQRDYLQGDVLQELLDYWTAQFDPLPAVLSLPTDHPRPVEASYSGQVLMLPLEQGLVAQIKSLVLREQVSTFMLFFAALQVLLYRYTGQTDLVVGTPIANRNRSEIECLIGVFVNTLAMRCDLSGNPTFRELLARVRKVSFDAYAHQDLPFEKLVETLDMERNLSHNPLFQVMLAVQNMPLPEKSEESDLQISLAGDVRTETSKFDLTVVVEFLEQETYINVEYNTALFEAATIERLFGHYQTLLQSIVDDFDRPISDLPMLTPPEREQLLNLWSHSGVDYAADLRIHEMFTAQVQQTPDKVAIVYNDASLTFDEVENQAQKLANLIERLQK